MADDFSSYHRQRHSFSHSSLVPDPYQASSNRDGFDSSQQLLLSSILRELQDANALNQKLAEAPPNKYDFIWTLLLQTFAVMTGIIFGVFAILAWVAANHSNTLASESLTAAQNANSLASQANAMATSANSLASMAAYTQATEATSASIQAAAANRMALVAYCSNVPANSSTAYALCSSLQSAAMATLSADVYTLFPQVHPTPPIQTQVSNGQPQPPSASALQPPPSSSPLLSATTTSTDVTVAGNAPTSGASSDSTPSQGLNPSSKVGIGLGAALGVLGITGVLSFLLLRSFRERELQARVIARNPSQRHDSDMGFQAIGSTGREDRGTAQVQMRHMGGGGLAGGSGGGDSQQPLISGGLR